MIMNSRIDFIYLNEREMIEADVRDMNKCMDSIEDMFILLDKGDYRMSMESEYLFQRRQILRVCQRISRTLDLWQCLLI